MFRTAAILVLFVIAMLLTGCSSTPIYARQAGPGILSPAAEEYYARLPEFTGTRPEDLAKVDAYMAAEKAKCPSCWAKLHDKIGPYHFWEPTVEVIVVTPNVEIHNHGKR